MSEIKKVNRIKYLDILRIIACLFILIQHSFLGDTDTALKSSIINTILFTLVVTGAPLFFMISGALMLPTKYSPKEFYKRRADTVIPPLIIWTLIYLINNWLSGDISNITFRICAIPFYPIEGILWFLYVLLGIYLIIPIVSIIIKNSSKRTVEVMLFIWLSSLFLPYLLPYLPQNLVDKSYFYQFCNYLGYPLMGYYLYNYPIQLNGLKRKLKIMGIFILFAVILPALAIYMFRDGVHSAAQIIRHDLSINMAILTAAVFTAVQKLFPEKEQKESNSQMWNTITFIAMQTFGIYLIHMLINKHILYTIQPIFSHVPDWLYTTISGSACFLISLVAVYLLSLLPYSNYIIGHKKLQKK